MVMPFNNISKIMQRNVETIEEEETVHKALEKMSFFRVSCLIVIRKGQPTGILTERDMINRVLLKQKNTQKITVKDIMTSPIVSKPSNFPIYKIVKIMNEYLVRHVPIIEEGKIIGIVTQTDIMKYMQNSLNKKIILQYFIMSLMIVTITILMLK